MKIRFRLILILLIAIAGISPNLHAADFRSKMKGRGCRFMWGVKAGFDFVTADKPFALPEFNFDNGGLGINAGFTARMQWRDCWYVQPALTLSYDTQSVELMPQNVFDGKTYASVRRGAVMLPIHLGYKFTLVGNSRMSIFSGGWVSYSFAGEISSSDSDERLLINSREPVLYGDGGLWSRISAGPAFGATLESTTFPLSLTIDGYVGVTQMSRSELCRYNYMTESLARLTFVYWFKL